MSNQTLLIGVDAGDFRIIEPMLEAGKLPNLQEIIQEGFRGSLSSSVPPWTPTAWTSLTTGKNPGKHGIFDFKMPGTDELVDATDIQTNTLWDYLTEVGKSSIILNVPVTHPVAEIDGVIIPGYLAPMIGEVTAHPPGILNELQDEIGEYRIYKTCNTNDAQRLCDEYLQLIQMRADAMTYLCKAYEWSFGMVQFQRTDTVFHELPDQEYIHSVYRKLDDCVGQLLSEIDVDNVIVASDHGMGRTGEWDFRINSWLAENGYLETTGEGFSAGWSKPDPTEDAGNDEKSDRSETFVSTLARLLARFGLTPRRVQQGLQRAGVEKIVERTIPESWIHTVIEEGGECIDINESAVYCPSGPGLGIVCNDAEPSTLIAELSALRDPDGVRVFEWVKQAQELYDGPAVNAAPDVILYPRAMAYYISATLTADVFTESRYAYNHNDKGIFIGAGSDIASIDCSVTAEIDDIAPTVLSLVGIPLDEAFDGNPIETVIDDVGIPETRQYEVMDRSTSTGERSSVKSRLEDLGYME